MAEQLTRVGVENGSTRVTRNDQCSHYECGGQCELKPRSVQRSIERYAASGELETRHGKCGVNVLGLAV